MSESLQQSDLMLKLGNKHVVQDWLTKERLEKVLLFKFS